MLQKLIHRLLEHRHFWRIVDFDELAELYTTRLIRMLAMNLMSVFILVYLLQLGFSLTIVLVYGAAYAAVKVVLSIPSGHIVGRVGPKHATFLSNIFHALSLLILVLIPTYGPGVLIVQALIQAFAVTLYDISFRVNFSKIKHVDHAGKELGYMFIIEKIATALSPVIGGAIATFFGAQWTLYVASALFVFSAIPLFFTPEPVRVHQRVRLTGMGLTSTWRGLLAEVAVGIDFSASNGLWSLFLALIVFVGSGNAVYVQVGAVTSITLLSGLIIARVYGMLIDHRRGRELLLFGVIGNSLLHLVRPFIGTPSGAVVVNMTNEVFTTAYNLPFVKGTFDTADSLPGYRIAYLTWMEITLSIGQAMTFVLALPFVQLLGAQDGLRWGYVLVALLTLSIAYNGFRVLLRR